MPLGLAFIDYRRREVGVGGFLELTGDVDDDLAARLSTAQGKARQALIELAGRLRIVAASAALWKAADDPDARLSAGAVAELAWGFQASVVDVLVTKTMRAAEATVNPAQSPAHTWGGGSTIGGSPRNQDGSGSRLAPNRAKLSSSSNCA